MTKDLLFFDGCFDKNRIKSLISWSVVHCGENNTINLVENLKNLGYAYATQAGVSLGLDDLKIPTIKPNLISDAEKEIQVTQINSKHDYVTGIEKFQQLIDTWNRTSEKLKQSVVQYFKATDILNPVYMMAFSGARGNISQVRQLVGMRGLMSDPQGQILDFPIKSNFREGLTLTEYIISCYGARKGIVDTALKTANSGYLTRRLVDVSHHIIICDFDCKTNRGILVNDIIENQKIILPLQTRLIGRILAENIYSTDALVTKQSYKKLRNHKEKPNLNALPLASVALPVALVSKKHKGQGKGRNLQKTKNYLISPHHLNINKKTQISKKFIFSQFSNFNPVSKPNFSESNFNKHFVLNKPKLEKFLYTPRKNGKWLSTQQNKARTCALFFEIASLYFVDVSIFISKNESAKNANIVFSNNNLLTFRYVSVEKKDQSKKGVHLNLNQLLVFLNYVHLYDIKKKLIASKNTEISSQLAAKIAFLKKNVLVRSPLTCEIKNSVCQLCYGWSLAYGKLVSLGEAVGVIAAQSIGEPGTQLTMRTFHTGGVFSGDVMSEITAPCNGIVHFSKSFQGTLIRTPHGKIAFLTKVPGTFEIYPTQIQNPSATLKGVPVLSVALQRKGQEDKLFSNNKTKQNSITFQIPAFTILFVRNHEFVNKTQVIAEFSAISTDRNQRILSRYDVKSEIEGEIIFDFDTGRKLIKIKIEKERAKMLKGQKMDLGIMANILDPKQDKLVSRTTMQVGTMWILSSKIYRQRISVNVFPQPGDIVDTNSIFGQYEAISLYNGFITFRSKKQEISITRKNPIAIQQVHKSSFLTSLNKNKKNKAASPLGRETPYGVVSRPVALPIALQRKGTPEFDKIKKLSRETVASLPSEVPPVALQRKGPRGLMDEAAEISIYKSFINQTIISFPIHSIQYKKIGYFFSFFKRSGSKKSKLEFDNFFLSNSLNQSFKTSVPLKTHFYFQSFPKVFKTKTSGIGLIDQFYIHEKMYYGEIFWISEEIYMFNSKNTIFVKPLSNSVFLKKNYTCVEQQIAEKKKYKKWGNKVSPLIFHTNSQGELSPFFSTRYGHTEIDMICSSEKNCLNKFPLPKQQITSLNNTPLKSKNAKKSFFKLHTFSKTKKSQITLVGKQPYWKLIDYKKKVNFITSPLLLKRKRQNLKAKNIKNPKFRKNLLAMLKAVPFFYLNFLKPNRNTKSIKNQLKYYFFSSLKQNKKINRKIIENKYSLILQPQFPFLNLLPINQLLKKENKFISFSTFLHLRSGLHVESQIQNKIKLKIKSGWIYFPTNLKQIINKHKCVIKPGLNCSDAIIFDQYPVFLECLSINKISIQQKKTIFKKTSYLKRILNIFDIFTKFEIPVCEKTYIKDRSHFKLVSLDKAFLSMYNTSFFFTDFNIDKILYNEKTQSIVSGLFYKSLSLDNYIKENTFSNFFSLVNLKPLRKLDSTILSINTLLANANKQIYTYQKIYFLNKASTASPVALLSRETTLSGVSPVALQRKGLRGEGFDKIKKLRRKGPDFAKTSKNAEKTFIESATKQFSQTNQVYDFSITIRKTNIYSYTKNFFIPKLCILIRKINSYSVTQSLEYKRLLIQENQPNVHCFLNPFISLNNYYNYTKLSSFTKQNSTSLFLNIPGSDFFVQPYFKDKEWKTNYFTKHTNILEYYILFTLAQNSLLTASKIDIIVKKNKSAFSNLVFCFAKQGVKQRNQASEYINPIKLNKAELPFGRGTPYGSEAIVSRPETLKQKTKNMFWMCFNKTLETKNTLVFSSTMYFTVSLFQKIQFSYLVPQSFSKKTSFACFPAKRQRQFDEAKFGSFATAASKKTAFVQTQVLVSYENSIANQAPASITTFFSPYQGEILPAVKQKVQLNEDALRLYNKYETLVDRNALKKHTYLILTNEDQISFSNTSFNSPINQKNIQINLLHKPSVTPKDVPSTILLGQFIKYGTKIKNNLALPESGQIIQIEKSKFTLRKAQSILFSPNGFLSVHHGDMIEKNALVLSLYYQRLKTGDIVQGIPKIEQLFEARQTYQGEKLVGSLHTQLEWLFYRYQSENNPQQAARRSVEKIQQIIVQNVQKVYQSQGVRIAEKHLEIIVRQMTSKVQIISGKDSLFLPGELVELDWIENANKGIEVHENRAIYKPIIQGITKKSLDTKSFISEASFQETTRILTKSAIQRKIDFLKGLKENVILGHVIPAGTGFIGKILDPNKDKYIAQSTLQSRYKSYTFFRNIFFETISSDSDA